MAPISHRFGADWRPRSAMSFCIFFHCTVFRLCGFLVLFHCSSSIVAFILCTWFSNCDWSVAHARARRRRRRHLFACERLATHDLVGARDAATVVANLPRFRNCERRRRRCVRVCSYSRVARGMPCARSRGGRAGRSGARLAIFVQCVSAGQLLNGRTAVRAERRSSAWLWARARALLDVFCLCLCLCARRATRGACVVVAPFDHSALDMRRRHNRSVSDV